MSEKLRNSIIGRTLITVPAGTSMNIDVRGARSFVVIPGSGGTANVSEVDTMSATVAGDAPQSALASRTVTTVASHFIRVEAVTASCRVRVIS